MSNLMDDKDKFEKAEKDINENITLKIFDFDNTLFRSPIPNSKLWDKRTLGKIEAEVKTYGYGWWQNPLTLSDRYINPDDFNEEIVNEVKKSMEDPNSVTVLLTGRGTQHGPQIKKLVARKGLVFDKAGLKPVGYPGSTLDFKLEFIKNTIDEINKTGRKVTSVEMWDDRHKHVQKFNTFLSGLGLQSYKVHEVSGFEASMPEDLERELVGILKQQYDERKSQSVNESTDPKPLYYAVVLDDESRNKLLSSFNVPEDWKKIAHHMTIIFNPKGNSELLEKTIQNLNKEVSLTATAVGKSNDAMAVKVDSEIPSVNSIPHITIAIPPQGKAVNSNKITEWTPLNNKIELKGTIKALYK